jgi:hypothetical protein
LGDTVEVENLVVVVGALIVVAALVVITLIVVVVQVYVTLFLFAIEVALDQTLTNWYQFMKSIHRVRIHKQ